MDKKQTTKKQYYFIVIAYDAYVVGEKAHVITTIQTDSFPTMGAINYVARMHCEKKHQDCKYDDNSAIITFFSKISKNEFLATQDKSVPADITVNIE